MSLLLLFPDLGTPSVTDNTYVTVSSTDPDLLDWYVDGTRIFRMSLAGILAENGTNIDEFSTDATLAGNSDLALPTEKAVKTYADTKAAVAQEDWTAPSLINSWVNEGGSMETAGYFKDSLGIVHIKGSIKTGTLATVAFVLPAGYRPAAKQRFGGASATGVVTRIDVDSSGNVTPVYGNNAGLSLDEITFRAA